MKLPDTFSAVWAIIGTYQPPAINEDTIEEKIIFISCKQLDVDPIHLRSKRSNHDTVYIKQILSYLLYKYTALCSTRIGVIINRHRTTVMYGRDLVIDQLSAKADNEYKRDVALILRQLPPLQVKQKDSHLPKN